MVPRENTDHEVVVIDIPLRAQMSTITHDNDHGVEVEFGVSRALLQARPRRLLASTNIGRGRRRRKQSVKGNEDVRTPSAQDLVLALDLHRLLEAL
jgi:hypothetical protein